MSFAFRPHEHLRRPQDFRRVYDFRRSVSDVRLIVYAAPNGLPHLRLGLSVSRKVGGAVVRNRLRRLYREAFRLTRHEMPAGLDLVLIPRGGGEPSLEDLKGSLPHLVRQVARRITKEGAAPMIRRLFGALRALVAAALIGFVRGYQVLLRPILPAVCRFDPSCSEYFILAVRKYGPLAGAARGAWRICRCNPFCRGGYDPP